MGDLDIDKTADIVMETVIPLFEEIAREDDGLEPIDDEAERVALGVTDGVDVPVSVPLTVGVPLIDTVLVILCVFELLGVMEGLEPIVNEAVQDTEMDVLCVTVEEAV